MCSSCTSRSSSWMKRRLVMRPRPNVGPRFFAISPSSILRGDATLLAAELVRLGGLPAKAKIDALHIVVASVHGMDYLVSWNCTHIANATIRGRIEGICRGAGFDPPVICTPIELVKEQAP